MLTVRKRTYETNNSYQDVFTRIRLSTERVDTLVNPFLGNLTDDTNKPWVGKINSSEGMFKIVQTNSSILPLRIFEGNFFTIFIHGKVHASPDKTSVDIKFRLAWYGVMVFAMVYLFGIGYAVNFIIEEELQRLREFALVFLVFDVIPSALLVAQLNRLENEISDLLAAEPVSMHASRAITDADKNSSVNNLHEGGIINIAHCNSCHPLAKDKAKYGTDIFAHRGFWRENLEVNYTLQSIPLEGQTQLVTLSGPLSTALNERLWIYYDLPLPYYNGYNSIDDIHGIRFCYGTIARVVKLTKSDVTIEFNIIQTKTLRELSACKESTPFLQEWEDFLTSFANTYHTGSHFAVQKFYEYYHVSCGSQGDVGQDCIIGEEADGHYAYMVNEWSIHEDFIFGGKFKLSRKFAELIVEHSHIAHRFFTEGKLFLKLSAASSYDTTTPHRWCLAKLNELNLLAGRSEFLIVGLGNRTFTIKSKFDFIQWVKAEFKGGFEDYF